MNSPPIEVGTWQVLARELIRINDLDPTYTLIHRGRILFGEDWANQFCLHMLMFYDVGEAAKAAVVDPGQFWDYVLDNFSVCKRGVERRHFKAANGLNSIADLQKLIPDPSRALKVLSGRTLAEVTHNFSDIRGFGPYFIWKACDYLDRCTGLPVDYSNAAKFLPSEPVKAAKYFWPDKTIGEALAIVVDEIKQYLAPPTYDRPCNESEAETVLCLMKGYFITKVHVIGDGILHNHLSFGLDDPFNLRRLLPPQVDLYDWVRV